MSTLSHGFTVAAFSTLTNACFAGPTTSSTIPFQGSFVTTKSTSSASSGLGSPTAPRLPSRLRRARTGARAAERDRPVATAPVRSSQQPAKRSRASFDQSAESMRRSYICQLGSTYIDNNIYGKFVICKFGFICIFPPDMQS